MNVVQFYLDRAHIFQRTPDHIPVEAISDYVPAYVRTVNQGLSLRP